MQVILVDTKDKQIGLEEKLIAHKKGSLHRAFSVFIFNSKNELMLQKRSNTKYHSSGLWSNTCCSHPQPNENLVESAKTRLKKEMGISCKLKEIFSFVYKADVDDLIEHEFDHVLIGRYNHNPLPNKEEVSDWTWISLKDLEQGIKTNPDKYTPWLKISLKKIKEFVS